MYAAPVLPGGERLRAVKTTPTDPSPPLRRPWPCAGAAAHVRYRSMYVTAKSPPPEHDSVLGASAIDTNRGEETLRAEGRRAEGPRAEGEQDLRSRPRQRRRRKGREAA
ncbi:MAG: hypothetical protein ACRDZX_04885, partial [Acidimicrobiales bacterium]